MRKTEFPCIQIADAHMCLMNKNGGVVMTADLVQDVRKVIIREDGKFVLTAFQEQQYDKENVDAMLADWIKRLEEYKKWLEKYDEYLNAGIMLLKSQMEAQKSRVEQEVKNLEEGIKLWQNAERSQN